MAPTLTTAITLSVNVRLIRNDPGRDQDSRDAVAAPPPPGKAWICKILKPWNETQSFKKSGESTRSPPKSQPDDWKISGLASRPQFQSIAAILSNRQQYFRSGRYSTLVKASEPLRLLSNC